MVVKVKRKREVEKQDLKNHVDAYINKGFNRKQIKDFFLKKGIDEKLTLLSIIIIIKYSNFMLFI